MKKFYIEQTDNAIVAYVRTISQDGNIVITGKPCASKEEASEYFNQIITELNNLTVRLTENINSISRDLDELTHLISTI